MKEPDLEQFEAELRRVRPAPASEEWLDRVAAELPTALTTKLSAAEAQNVTRPPAVRLSEPRHLRWRRWIGWGIPATAVAMLCLLVLRPESKPVSETRAAKNPSGGQAVIKANRVEVDQELVAAFDAVAQLPDGEPVRFRCRQWNDSVTLRDSARGVVIQHEEPRLEIVPVRFETY